MICRIIKILIVLSIFLSYSLSYLYAQERQESREQARQHYLQGKEFYSQGRYQEATIEFQRAMTIITPKEAEDYGLSEVEFMEKMQKEQEKTLAPGAQAQGATPQRAMTIITPSTVEFMEKVQKEEEKTLAPAPILPKELPSAKERLKKKKIEGKEKEEKETGVAKAPAAPVPILETKEPQEREYYIDTGDVLDISVWQIPDLTKPDVIVRPDGKISFPLIGDIKVEGLTITQLDDIITEKLKAYVRFPEVSIMIRRFGEQANKVVILGEILGPGVYRFGGPPTITEVIASAGGYTKYAVLNSIMVIRGDVMSTKPEVTRVNFARILKSGRLTENIFLKPNDIVYVPRSFIGNINTFLEIFQPAISEYMQTMNARHFHNIMHKKP